MKEFERSEDYLTRIFLDALDRHVVIDAKVEMRRGTGSKLKAYCPIVKANLQFPSKLREYQGQKFTADVIKAKKGTGIVFYRAYRGSIRDEKGDVVG